MSDSGAAEPAIMVVGPAKGSGGERNPDGTWKWPRRNVLYVKTVSGACVEIGLPDFSTGTVLDIRRWTAAKLGVPAPELRLIFAGRQLEDKQTLAETGAEYECTWHAILRRA